MPVATLIKRGLAAEVSHLLLAAALDNRMPWVGFKTLPSGYAATNPWSVGNKQATGNTSAKAVAGALYTWWQVQWTA